MSIGNLKDSGNQGNNFPWQLKVLQGLQAIFDEVAQPLTCVEDSVTICPPAGGLDVNIHDGAGTAITSTTIGSDTGVDVNIIGGVTLEVNLDAANDQVGVYGYTNPADPSTYTGIKTDASGVLAIQDNGGSITVDANDLDIRNLTFATDKVDASGSSVTVSGTVTANAGTGNFTVVQPTASNLNATVVGGTGVSRTPNFLRPTGVSGTVAAGTYSMSFASVGTADATVGSITLKPGETLNFDAGAINNTLGAVNYSTTTAGAELIIITLT